MWHKRARLEFIPDEAVTISLSRDCGRRLRYKFNATFNCLGMTWKSWEKQGRCLLFSNGCLQLIVRNIRELALHRILKARNSKATRTVRRFRVPQLNFEASDYTELINWTDEVTEPPVIMNISDKSIAEKETPSLFFPRFPCHTQAVERCIKLVTEASTAVSGKRNRDGFIRNKFQSCTLMPHFNTKLDYKLE